MQNLFKNNPAFAALAFEEFKYLMVGRFLFIMGLRMMGTLVGWWMYELTNDPFAIGLIGLAEVVPAVSLSLYAGHIIDISEKRKLLLTGVILYLGCALSLLILSSSFSTNHLSALQISYFIYAVIFLTGVFRAFTGPSFHAIIGLIVPKNILANATTINQGTWLTASVLGHALGGIFIATIDITGTLIAIVSTVCTGYLIMRNIQPKPPLNVKGEKKTLESVKEGLQFVFKTKEVLGALTLDLFAVLFGGAVAMVPVFAKDILKVGPTGFGWLNAATDIGAIVSVITLTFFPLKQQQGKKLFFAVAAFGVCIIIFALSKYYWLSFFALLCSGLVDGISVVIRGTILQLKTPDHMRGRVMSVNSMFINSSNELGQFESGVAAKIFGVIPSVIFGGGMTLLVTIFTWFKAPSLRKMEY